MGLNIRDNHGQPLDRQRFTWRDMFQLPISKLDDDAYTRVHIILLGGLEQEALRFSHACARMNQVPQPVLAQLRRIEQHQATTANGLIGADHSPLETTIAYEQLAIDVTAGMALREPGAYLAQVYRFGLLEDFDHLYRYAALLDRLEGKGANNVLQSYTDILPGRPTLVEHRHPLDDLRAPYERQTAHPLSRLHALTLMAAEQQTHNYYMTAGPLFTDPMARLLYAEIASIEEQHITQYESIIDPSESWLEKWVLHEAAEVYNYHGCMEQEQSPRLKALWARFLDYELGHLHVAIEHFQKYEGRDVAQILPAELPDPIPIHSQRAFVRQVLLDKLGERLAFERSGVRLCDALLVKSRAQDSGLSQAELGQLQRFREEEAQHFELLASVVEDLGGAPTAQTPSADLAGGEGLGLMQAVNDPRTSFAQSLHVVLDAELIDSNGWELLIRLARQAGHADVTERFETARQQEAVHLRTLLALLSRLTLTDAGVAEPG